MAVVMAMAVVMGYMPSMQECFVACFDEAERKVEGRRRGRKRQRAECDGHKYSILFYIMRIYQCTDQRSNGRGKAGEGEAGRKPEGGKEGDRGRTETM